MSGLGLRIELKRRGLDPQPPVIVPLGEPVNWPLYFEGIAAPVTVDKEHTRFRPWSISLPSMLGKPLPELLWRHREPAGRIERLDYDARGQLTIRAYVTHPLALRASHFSICANVKAYRMGEGFAEVTDATVAEVSITDRPCNPDAKILGRYFALDYDDVFARLQRCKELAREMRA